MERLLFLTHARFRCLLCSGQLDRGRHPLKLISSTRCLQYLRYFPLFGVLPLRLLVDLLDLLNFLGSVPTYYSIFGLPNAEETSVRVVLKTDREPRESCLFTGPFAQALARVASVEGGCFWVGGSNTNLNLTLE